LCCLGDDRVEYGLEVEFDPFNLRLVI
jgi:hypothetical protein